MKRYRPAYSVDDEGNPEAFLVESEIGEAVLYSEAQERIDALEKLAKYTRHSPECECSKPPYEWSTRGGLRCTCGLDAALAAGGK